MTIYLSIFLLLALTSVIFLSIDLVSFSLKRTGWSRLVFTFLLFYSQIIMSQFVLGTLHLLTGYAVAILNLTISVVLIYTLWRKNGRNLFKDYLASLKLPLRTFLRTVKNDHLWTFILIISMVFLLWIVFLGIIFPTMDYDGYSYHMTFIANVIQHGTFFDQPTSLAWLNGYPKGGEFIQMWSVVLTNSDILVDLTQLPFLFLGSYALYNISISLGADKKQARFSALLLLFIPVVLNQLKTTYVDVMLMSLFFTSIAIIIKSKLNNLDLLLLGITFSLIISIKSTGFIFVAVVVPLLLWRLFSSRKKNGAWFQNYLKPLLVIAVPTLFGFYWYIKNYILYGTPIYPFGFKLFGKSIFPGKTFQEFGADAVVSTSLPDGCFQRIWFVWTEQKDWFGCLYNYDTNYAGMGPIWFTIMLPAIIVALYLALRRKNYLLLSFAATIGVLFAIYPANYYSRYTMFIAGLGIVSLAYVLTHISKSSRRFTRIVTTALVIFVIFTNFAMCNFTPEAVKNQFKSIVGGSVRGEVYEDFPGPAYLYIEKNVQPDETVAYDSKPFFIYPLWRHDYSNNVIYVPSESEEEWEDKIQDKNVDYIFTTVYSRENEWAADSYESVYRDSKYEIFKVD